MSYYRYKSSSTHYKEPHCPEPPRHCPEPPRHYPLNPCPPFPPPPCPTGSFYKCDHTRIYNTGCNPTVVLQANPDNISGHADNYFSLNFNESGPQGLITNGYNFTIFSSSAGATGYGPVLTLGNYDTQYYASNGNVSIGDEARSAGARNFIFGSDNDIIGNENYILGMNNASTGSYNFTLGNANSIQGAGSYAFGQNLIIPFSRIRTYAFGFGNTVETSMPDILYPNQPNIQLLNDQGVAAILSTDANANGFLRLNGTGSFAEAEHIVSRGTGYFQNGIQITGDLVVKTIRSSTGDLEIFATPENEIHLHNPVRLDNTFNQYSYLRLSGGNSDGALWGYFPYNNTDGIYLSYNFYVKRDVGGSPQVVIPNAAGQTAAVLVSYDRISFRVGAVNTPPTERARIEETTFRTPTGVNMDIGTSGQPWQRIYGVTGIFSTSVNTPRVVVDTNVVISSSNITFNQPGADKIIQSTSLGNMLMKVYPSYLFRFSTFDGITETGIMQILTLNRALQPLNSGGPVNLGVPADRWNTLYAYTGSFLGNVEIGGTNNANKFIVRNNASQPVFWVNTTNNTAFIYNGITVTSDGNEKEDIENIPFGLNLIKALQAKAYRLKRDPSGKRNFGFLAQQFKETLENLGIDPIENEFVVEYNEEGMSDVLDEEGNIAKDSEGNVITEGNGVFTKKYGIKYSNLYAPMVKGIQELAAENDQLKSDVQTLQTELSNLNTTLSAILSRLDSLENP